MESGNQTFRRVVLGNLTIDHLVTFRAVCKATSFRRAAEELKVSQPAVSQRIKHLESVVGAPLFDRRAGAEARVTEVGERLLGLADAVLGEFEAFQRDLKALKEPAPGERVSVAAGPGYIKYRLLDLVGGLARRHPGVEVHFRQGDSPEAIARLVLEGGAEIGVYVGPVPEGFRSFALPNDWLVLVAARGHPILATEPERRIEGLRDTPFAISSDGAHSRQLIDRWAASHDLPLHVTLETGNLDTLKEAVLQRLAVAVLPDFAVARELGSGEMEAVEISGLPQKRRVSLVASSRRPLSPLARAFVQVATDALGSPAGGT